MPLLFACLIIVINPACSVGSPIQLNIAGVVARGENSEESAETF